MRRIPPRLRRRARRQGTDCAQDRDRARPRRGCRTRGVRAHRGRASNGAAPSTAASSTTDRSIAVLPLANLSGDKADDYFGIGLSEEMTRALAKTGVRVIGRVSAGALAAKGLDERAIAKELGVGSLLTGSVQRAAGQVRINVSLVSAADGAVKWTEKYDRPLTNVFAVQDEIARAVAAQTPRIARRHSGRLVAHRHRRSRSVRALPAGTGVVQPANGADAAAGD